MQNAIALRAIRVFKNKTCAIRLADTRTKMLSHLKNRPFSPRLFTLTDHPTRPYRLFKEYLNHVDPCWGSGRLARNR